MEIDSKKVMQLRAATGLGMMTCKKALVAESGDYEKALDRLRKEGLKVADSKAGRATGEGRIAVRISEDGRRGSIVGILCETEPVSNTPLFTEFVDALLTQVDAGGPTDADALLASPWTQQPSETVDQALRGLVAKLGENLRVAAAARLEVDGKGLVGSYLHHDHKSAALVVLKDEGKGADLATLAKDLCMHIVSSKPTALTRDEIPASDRDKETEIYRAQVASDPKMANKPAQVVDKIVEGKIAAYYKSKVLPEQPWIRDDSLSVAAVLKQHGASIQAFRLVQVGA